MMGIRMVVSEDVLSLIRKHAIKNAIDYGKADDGSVLGKVIPQSRGIPIPELKAEVQRVVTEVNSMAKSDLLDAYAPFEKEFEKRAEETAMKTGKPKMSLDGAEVGNFATRWPPEPSGYQHIGHAKPIFLEDEFRRIYKGKLFLYFDDTNPEKARQEYVDADKADLAWFGIKFDKEYYASDNIDKIYGYARKLILDGHAYTCACSQETMKKKRLAMEECEHRAKKPDESLSEFDGMIAGAYEEGAMVLRFRGDMGSDNTVMRDPTIARIKKAVHYRQGTKYNVWPTYDLATPINDSLNGVTDVLRSKEYELRDALDTTILKLLGLRVPRIHPFSRLNIIGNTTHKREIREMIADGAIKGWDDPRLMTLIAIRRRGVVPEAIRAFALRAGMTKTDSELSLESLLAENKKAIDPIAKHLFFVSNPVRVEVQGFAGVHASLRLHPSSNLGTRSFDTGSVFYISGADAETAKAGDMIRLKDLIDIKVLSKSQGVITAVPGSGDGGGRIIQWVSAQNMAECSVLIPGPIFDDSGAFNPDSLVTMNGYVEGYAQNLSEHEHVQFERFGYCILDRKETGRLLFIFTSK